MELNRFLARSRIWHPLPESADTKTRSNFYIMDENDDLLPVKHVDESYDRNGNKTLDVYIRSTACGHVVEDPKQLVVADGRAYSEHSVHVCADCDEQILPGKGVFIEASWFHRECNGSQRQHAEQKRALDEDFARAKLGNLERQNDQLEAQTDATIAHAEIEDQRLEMERARETRNAALAVAQTQAVYEGLELQRERLELDKQAATDRSATVASQLDNEELRRLIEQGRFKVEILERMKRLESGDPGQK